MLTFDPADGRPARKLLGYVLLMAARDGASAVRFEPYRQALGIWYFAGGEWYGLVPTPARVWSDLRAVVRDAASARPQAGPDPWGLVAEQVARDLDGRPPLPRSRRWWQPKPAAGWVGGTLDFRFGDQTARWVVALDDRRGRESLLLTAAQPAGPPGDATNILRRAFGRPNRQPVAAP